MAYNNGRYELIIVGAGPAGLSAALTAAYFKLKTLVVESGAAGGALANIYPWKEVYCYLGFRGLKGGEIAKRMVEHVRSEGIEIHENEEVKNIIKSKGKDIIVETTKGKYITNTVILATGLNVPKKLNIPGEEYDNVYYHLPVPEKFKERKVIVVGGGDTAVERALILQINGAETTLVHRRDTLRASDENIAKIKESNIEIIWNTELKKIGRKNNKLIVTLLNKKNDKRMEMEFDSVFIAIGTTSNKEFFDRVNIKLDEKNHVIVDECARTNIEGIFAAGDIVGRWLRIPEAVGEGGYAALNAYKYIRNPYWA